MGSGQALATATILCDAIHESFWDQSRQVADSIRDSWGGRRFYDLPEPASRGRAAAAEVICLSTLFSSPSFFLNIPLFS